MMILSPNSLPKTTAFPEVWAAILAGEIRLAEGEQSPDHLPSDFVEDLRSAREHNRLDLLILLGMEVEGAMWEGAALFLIAQAIIACLSAKHATLARSIVFTGHRIDSPQRQEARFPAGKEPLARQAIEDALRSLQAAEPGPFLGIAGGANGGDILFHEVCTALAIPTELLLPLPPDQFARASVANEDPTWERRFQRLCGAHVNIPVLAKSLHLPEWLAFKAGYDIWQRNNLWLLSRALSDCTERYTLIALWDGECGDGPGGTEHMVSIAKAFHSRFVWLNTKEIFTRPSPESVAAQG